VFQNIQFRDCLHRGVIGPTPEAAVAAILSEACMPAGSPVEADAVFLGVAQVLGGTAFRAVWSQFQKRSGPATPDPRLFAEFLSEQEPGRTLPQLVDLARFDLAHFLAAQPSATPSIGACCLPEALIRAHPELVLRYHPGWRYLQLNWPVHRLLPEILSASRLGQLIGPVAIGIRIGLGDEGVTVEDLSPASFALQTGLRSGQRLADAAAAAQAIDPTLDPFAIVARLINAGAVIDAILHPAEAPPSSKRPTSHSNPNP
jgi:hypothetical protein